MNVRRWKKAAELLIVCAVLMGCIGCRDEKEESLEVLQLEDTADLQEESERQEDGRESVGEKAAESDASGDTEDSDTQRTEKQKIFVHVCGAVQFPGVYELEEGARLCHAIACAGGVREDAAEEMVNQAQSVADGERLYIPSDEEVRQEMEEFLKAGIAVGDRETVPGTGEVSGGGDLSGSAGTQSSAGGKVNINTASKEELKTLNGIGDTRADSILAYREANGPFGSIDDLKKVDGIKDGVFNKIRNEITVNTEN